MGGGHSGSFGSRFEFFNCFPIKPRETLNFLQSVRLASTRYIRFLFVFLVMASAILAAQLLPGAVASSELRLGFPILSSEISRQTTVL